MQSYKLPKEIKNMLEREIRQYKDNKKELENLKQISSEPTRRYLYIEKRLLYIERAYNRLKPFEKQIYNLIFFENRDCVYCENYKNISRSTYYNILNKSLLFLAQEWGEI